MLRIEIPSNGQSGLTFTKMEQFEIPSPPNGFDSEVNGNVIMLFDDEQQAVDYSRDLQNYANSIDNSSIEYRIINDITEAVGNDGFVKAYTQS